MVYGLRQSSIVVVSYQNFSALTGEGGHCRHTHSSEMGRLFSHRKCSSPWEPLLLTPLGLGSSAFLAFDIHEDREKKKAWKGRKHCMKRREGTKRIVCVRGDG